MSTTALISGLAKLAANPQVRKFAANAASTTVKSVGRSRARRSKRGQWYAGKRLGIPPQISSAPATVGVRVTAPPTRPVHIEAGSEVLDTVIARKDGFSTWSYSVNPCEDDSFPRLAQLAKLYQKYTCESLTYEYIPSVPTGYQGAMGVAVQADPTSRLVGSFEEFMSLNGSVSAPVWQTAVVTVPRELMAQTARQMVCKQNMTPQQQDEDRLTTICRLSVALNNIPSAGLNLTYGTIKVHYRFTFRDPKLNVSASTTSFTSLTPIASQPFDFIAGASGLPPFVFDDDGTHTFRKRTLGPILLAVHSTAQPVLTRHAGGSVVTASLVLGDTTFYHFPAGGKLDRYLLTAPASPALTKVFAFTVHQNFAMA